MDIIEEAKQAMLTIQVMNSIARNQAKSYVILADKEAVLICKVIELQIRSNERLMLMPTVATDLQLLQIYMIQNRELTELLADLQHQLVMNAKPKPQIPEA